MTKENLMDGYTLDFDDGNCGETYDYNGNPGGRVGDGKPCIGSFVVPTGTAPGIYSMVWYWTFWLDNGHHTWINPKREGTLVQLTQRGSKWKSQAAQRQ
ncbi:hypothetical protein P3T76_016236 [Phytophthora citrophthora]|uniref:Uncharacterized protein n=1 Tax=Phytophthora citrophthora TaxID=4793 RepID=A0AAD9LA87_9STRA|nr:hypothetical protein P3T76_016236 [Phytophthora citrophthora]